MKRTSFAVAALLALSVPAFAADTKEAVQADGTYYVATEKTDFQASKLIGSRVYATEAAVDGNATFDKADEGWDDIGEINNLVVSRDGAVQAAVIGVGGFLGIGEKNVAVKMNQLKFLKKSGDDANDYFIVVSGNKASLEKAPEYKVTE
jgi:hypothetical protein